MLADENTDAPLKWCHYLEGARKVIEQRLLLIRSPKQSEM